MTVLVLGGTRFFGIHMVKALLENGHQVTIATRGKANDPFGKQVERVILDRNSPDRIAETLGGKFFNVVCDNLAYCSNDVKYLLDHIGCERYIMTSSASVYTNQHLFTKESEFSALSYPLKWCNRQDYPYDEAKRQAECALFQAYPHIRSVAVRLPYVIGGDDYTKRLYCYVDQIIKGDPIFVDNLNEEIGFIRSSEAGNFIAWLADQKFTGAINGGNTGTISLQEIMDYVEQKVGKKAQYAADGLAMPYNGQRSFSLDVGYASTLGYRFTDLKEWIFMLLDCLIDTSYEQR